MKIGFHKSESNNGDVCIDKRNLEMFWHRMKALTAKLTTAKY